jgi:hypothetical protein
MVPATTPAPEGEKRGDADGSGAEARGGADRRERAGWKRDEARNEPGDDCG